VNKRAEKSPVITASWRRALARSLLAWFESAARELPWRGTTDLYAIWVSEVMLQQTQVATVIPYWTRFLARFPDVIALANAPEQDVLRHWEGLGYYRRARQLHRAAQQIVETHRGQLPITFADLRALPGIGRYTAGAILSIGQDQRLPILEANTIRVLSRITAFQGEASSTAGQKHLWAIAEAILPKQRCGSFNQALMELGSEICTPKSPDCAACPVQRLCDARRLNLVSQIPLISPRVKSTPLTEIAVIVRHRGRVLLRECQTGERWAGLWDFPRFAASADQSLADLSEHICARTRELTGARIQLGSQFATMKHGVTRYRITLHCFAAKLCSGASDSTRKQNNHAARWLSLDELGTFPLSVTGRKISQLLSAIP
jgi:A/G-specific adenine glycosylase